METIKDIEAIETVTKTAEIYLVRYGTFPEVARFENQSDEFLQRGSRVVIETDRGLQLGTALERLKPTYDPQQAATTEFKLLRVATETDLLTAHERIRECESAFPEWSARIVQWKLNLELIDLEWTLDRQKLILYVLCERGPDSTKLALQAAASGLGVIEVQPVSATGLVTIPKSGCGTDGGGCGCSH